MNRIGDADADSPGHAARVVSRVPVGLHQSDPGATAFTEAREMIPHALRLTSQICARLLIIGLALAVVIFVVAQVSFVVIPVAVALLLTALLAPVVDAAVRHAHLSRGLSIGVVLIGGIATAVGVLFLVVNAVIAGLPALLSQLIRGYQITIRPLLAGPPLRIPVTPLDNLPAHAQQWLLMHSNEMTTTALSTAATATETIFETLLGLFVLVFFLHQRGRMWRFGLLAVPVRSQDRVNVAGQRAFASLVGHARVTVFAALVDTIGIGIGLELLRTPLVIPLAALIFLGTFIPIAGTMVSSAAAVAVTLMAHGLWTALGALGVTIAVMQLRGHMLRPLILGPIVTVHPLGVALSVACGVATCGITGALFAAPIATIVTTAIRSLTAPAEPPPHQIDALRPQHAEPGPPKPHLRNIRRRLLNMLRHHF